MNIRVLRAAGDDRRLHGRAALLWCLLVPPSHSHGVPAYRQIALAQQRSIDEGEFGVGGQSGTAKGCSSRRCSLRPRSPSTRSRKRSTWAASTSRSASSPGRCTSAWWPPPRTGPRGSMHLAAPDRRYPAGRHGHRPAQRQTHPAQLTDRNPWMARDDGNWPMSTGEGQLRPDRSGDVDGRPRQSLYIMFIIGA
jgi:hypothetical protein